MARIWWLEDKGKFPDTSAGRRKGACGPLGALRGGKKPETQVV